MDTTIFAGKPATKQSLKNSEEFKSFTGWGKMFRQLPGISYGAIYLLNVLIDAQPFMEKAKCIDEGYEDYTKCSNSWLEEQMGPGLTSYTIRQLFDELKDAGYVDSILTRKRNYGQERFIKLNEQRILEVLEENYTVVHPSTPRAIAANQVIGANLNVRVTKQKITTELSDQVF